MNHRDTTMTIATIADLHAALIKGVELPGAANHATIVKAMLMLSGRDETALARALNVSIPTIGRYADGTSSPHAALRPTMYSQFLGMLPAGNAPPASTASADPFEQDAWSEQQWEDAISEGRARLDEAPTVMQRLLTGRDR